MKSHNEFVELIRAQRDQARTAARAFAESVARNDLVALRRAIPLLETSRAFPGAFRRIRGLSASAAFRAGFVEVWEERGQEIRDGVNDDLLLIAGLRTLMPPYDGDQITLYRGESIFAWQRRRYGLAWTDDIGVAKDFAMHNQRMTDLGGILIRAIASSEAVICAVAMHGNSYGESEYLVDRRKIGRVIAVEQFPADRDRSPVTL